MKPEYIGAGNFDTDNYVYAYCECPLPFDYAIKWPRIKDGKAHRYACVCEDCGTAVAVISKSHDSEVLPESDEEYEVKAKVVNRGNCMMCGKELTEGEGIFFCKECEDKVNSRSLCDSCITDGCIFQSGIVRKHCDFYKSENEVIE